MQFVPFRQIFGSSRLMLFDRARLICHLRQQPIKVMSESADTLEESAGVFVLESLAAASGAINP